MTAKLRNWSACQRSVAARFLHRNQIGGCIGVLWIVLAIAGSVQAQQSNPAIEQSRLFPRTVPPNANAVSADGFALPEGETTSSGDEGFGAQQILKEQEKIPDFTITAGTMGYFTNNVALTHSATQSEGFFVGDVGVNWTPRINPQFQFLLGTGASLFRYETSALDFENLAAGTGIAWTPPNAWGLALIARYDFVELLDRHADEILQDHEFSLALQKIVSLGRSHALSFAVLGSAGISHPFAEQRDQAGLAVGYHLQLTRSLGTDLGYRLSGYFYSQGGRDDVNQVLSLGLHYNISPWLAVNGFVSAAKNGSNQSAFKYEVLSSGGGVSLLIRF
ncbi:MAG TPA: hypothetical protein VGM62_03195 [Chthoniobacterales bacterium]